MGVFVGFPFWSGTVSFSSFNLVLNFHSSMEPIFGIFGIFGIIVSIFLPPEILASSQQKEKKGEV